MDKGYIKKLASGRGKGRAIYSAAGKNKAPLPSESEILDLGAAEPDGAADFFVVDALYREASKWENRGYSSRHGSFNETACEYLSSQFGVSGINAESEIYPTSGTCSAINLLTLAFINKGDSALITKPSATTLGTMTRWLGGAVVSLPLSHKNGFFPKYEDIPQKSLKKAKLLYINYPNNPTGAVATGEFFDETIKFASANNLIVLHDAAYAALTYDEGRRLSFLSVPSAKKVGVELHSVSHAFNMAGWRAGFMAGNKNVIKAFADICAKSGTGQFTPILNTAEYAMKHPEISIGTAAKYKRRAELLMGALERLGLGMPAKTPEAGYYVFAKAPVRTACGLKFREAMDFEDFLLSHGIKVKAFDDGYIRYSLAFPALGEEEERRFIGAFYEKLGSYEFCLE